MTGLILVAGATGGVGQHLIGMLNESGYLSGDPGSLCEILKATPEQVDKVLARLQRGDRHLAVHVRPGADEDRVDAVAAVAARAGEIAPLTAGAARGFAGGAIRARQDATGARS